MDIDFELARLLAIRFIENVNDLTQSKFYISSEDAGAPIPGDRIIRVKVEYITREKYEKDC